MSVWIKKVRVYTKVGIYPCNGNGTFGTRHSPFNSKLNGPFNTAFACFQLSEIIFLNWSAFYCGRRYHVHVRVCKSGEACCYFLGYMMSL